MPFRCRDRSTGTSGHPPLRTLRLLALFELLKGGLTLAAVAAANELVHLEQRHALETLLARLPFSVEGHVARMLLRGLDVLHGQQIGEMAALASGYALLRAVEAFGLWTGRAWGQWVALISAISYLPWEIWQLWRHSGIVHATLLAGNLALVAYLAGMLILVRRS